MIDYVARNLGRFPSGALQNLPLELRAALLEYCTKKNLLGSQNFSPLLNDTNNNPVNEIGVIDLSEYKEVQPHLIANIAQAAPRLKALIFKECTSLNDQG